MSSLSYATVLILLSFAFPNVLADNQKNAAQDALLPAVHWDRDTSDLQNLLPVNSHQLYYSDSGISGMLTSSLQVKIKFDFKSRSHPRACLCTPEH